jgi:hypothetical protein
MTRNSGLPLAAKQERIASPQAVNRMLPLDQFF